MSGDLAHRMYDEPVACPYCGYQMDATTAVDGPGDKEPKAGDVAFCIACGRVAVFTSILGRLRPVPPTAEQLAEYLADPRIGGIIDAWNVVRARHLLGRQGWPGTPG